VDEQEANMLRVRNSNDAAAPGRTRAPLYLLLPLTAALGMAGFLAAGAIAQQSTVTGCAATGHTIALCSTKLGPVLVNSKGHTLYLFKKDSGDKSSCYGRCATFWPPLLKHGTPTLGPGVKKSLLGMSRRSNGTRQLTYNKHPLYTYKLDTRAGKTNGEGVNAFGAKWYALSRSGIAVKPTTTTTTTGTTTCSTPPCY
jgi:predicted lipoprotein with Yx(FWY)xxD motif